MTVADQVQEEATAIFALTSRKAVLTVLRKAGEHFEWWPSNQHAQKPTPMLALHYARHRCGPYVEGNMGDDWNALLQSAAVMAAYLIFVKVYGAPELLDQDVVPELFYMLAAIVEHPDGLRGF